MLGNSGRATSCRMRAADAREDVAPLERIHDLLDVLEDDGVAISDHNGEVVFTHEDMAYVRRRFAHILAEIESLAGGSFRQVDPNTIHDIWEEDRDWTLTLPCDLFAADADDEDDYDWWHG